MSRVLAVQGVVLPQPITPARASSDLRVRAPDPNAVLASRPALDF